MGCVRFFRRKRLGFDPERFEGLFDPAEFVNVDAFLAAPVVGGMWRQHEIWDGTYTLGDLLDAHEIMSVKAENQRRFEKNQEIIQQMAGR